MLLPDATGVTHHEHDNASTTFAGNEPVVNGTDYEISFRAKWVNGGNWLLSRLFVNRVAAISTIEMPKQVGTHGNLYRDRRSNLLAWFD